MDNLTDHDLALAAARGESDALFEVPLFVLPLLFIGKRLKL
jgi:hypothetical protein